MSSSHHKRLLFRAWSRTLHIYLSLLGLVLVVFFAVTGFFLNHPDWFALDRVSTRTEAGTLAPAILNEPDKLAVVEKLRAGLGARGALDSFDVQDDELRVVFKAPGRRDEAVIKRQDGQTEMTHETRGVLARLSELHRGDDAGPAWRLVIDAVAILILISAGTGVTLWLLVPKWRAWGVAAIVVCIAVTLAIYLMLVP